MSVPLFPSSIVPTPVDPSLVLVRNLTYRPSHGKTTGVTPPRMRSRTPRESFNPSSLQSRLMGLSYAANAARKDGEQKITPGCAHEATLHMQAHGSNTVSIITITISTKLQNPSRTSQQECTRKGTKERYGQNDP
ncbi:uncharacterized protein CLUP02_01140 [Colletotrichum lupini]|uniref:Uncharacterized protein n=1 Tax=Colletotrichum lupini TaxID=145971 RepID=A0A9Q8SC39_9PEZI|nr:uncharacterized protein CLUP02_01140 [Colletotrichum lupini]UQC74489.1 hypothetical protein CLUP02_01140 [Colletotrichum lupini]